MENEINFILKSAAEHKVNRRNIILLLYHQ